VPGGRWGSVERRHATRTEGCDGSPGCETGSSTGGYRPGRSRRPTDSSRPFLRRCDPHNRVLPRTSSVGSPRRGWPCPGSRRG
jgi:hypothetical protein